MSPEVQEAGCQRKLEGHLPEKSAPCTVLLGKLKAVLSVTFCNKHVSSICSPSSWTSVFSVFPTICFGFQVILASVLKRVAFAGYGDSQVPWESVASLSVKTFEDLF